MKDVKSPPLPPQQRETGLVIANSLMFPPRCGARAGAGATFRLVNQAN